MKIKLQTTGRGLIENHLLYSTWLDMKRRCYKVNRHNYKYYGERGIRVCDKWLDSFVAFAEDMGERPLGYTLDRIDNNGDYEPNNCKWSTKSEQAYNRRPYSKSGIKGVYFHKHSGKWRAEKNRTHLGYFDSPTEAAKVFK